MCNAFHEPAAAARPLSTGSPHADALWALVDDDGWRPVGAVFFVFLGSYILLASFNGGIFQPRSHAWNVRIVAFVHAVIALVCALVMLLLLLLVLLLMVCECGGFCFFGFFGFGVFSPLSFPSDVDLPRPGPIGLVEFL
jgi:hypothetical protein